MKAIRLWGWIGFGCLWLAGCRPVPPASNEQLDIFPIQTEHGPGFINHLGVPVSAPPHFSEAGDFSEGLAAAVLAASKSGGNLYGYINVKGDVVIPAQFDVADAFSEGLAAVVVNNREGFVNTQGQWVIQPTYYRVQGFKEGLAQVDTNCRQHDDGELIGCDQGFIDRSGHLVFESTGTSFLGSFSNGLARFKGPDGAGYFDKQGNVLGGLTFRDTEDFKEGLGLVWVGGRVGFINSTGTLVIPALYFAGESFSEGLACVLFEGGLYGYINAQGKTVIPPQFKVARSFSEGRAQVGRLDGDDMKYGFIDSRGTLVVPYQYDQANDFYHGLAWVSKEARTEGEVPPKPYFAAYINPDGKVVWRGMGRHSDGEVMDE